VTQIYYFTAEWCGPCKKVRPIVEELNRDQVDVKFQIIDVDSEGELTRKFDVKSIPTFIRIEDGEEVDRIIGAQTKKDLERFIK
jgi:thioredoxin 1